MALYVALAAEVEHLLNQIGRLTGLIADHVHPALDRMRGPQRSPRHMGVEHNHRQNVVEVVGHTRRELAHRRQAFLTLLLKARLPLLRRIADHHDPEHRLGWLINRLSHNP